ncbi:MAG: hypothetical protein PWP27_2490 [Clostridiales bacterium]|jgi:putative sporulation protein YtaF|nr:hypothetical protein [Clostridiales bacterium]
MNSVLSVVIVAVAVSLDGFWGGFAFGLRKIKISFLSLLMISSWSVICSMVAMLIGVNLKSYISLEVAKYIGAVLLLLLGLFTLKEGYNQKNESTTQEKNSIKFDITVQNLVKVLCNPLLADIDKENDIKPAEGIILGLAVAMDASIAAFTLSLFGLNPYLTPFLFGITHFILIGAGNIIARYNIINHLGEKLSLLPGFILVVMALLRLV